MTLSVTLCVRSLTLGAMMVFSEDGGEGHLFSLLLSEKLSVMRGILLMVLYLLRFESEVEPSRLDLMWLNGPEKKSDRAITQSVTAEASHSGTQRTLQCFVWICVIWTVRMEWPITFQPQQHNTYHTSNTEIQK